MPFRSRYRIRAPSRSDSRSRRSVPASGPSRGQRRSLDAQWDILHLRWPGFPIQATERPVGMPRRPRGSRLATPRDTHCPGAHGDSRLSPPFTRISNGTTFRSSQPRSGSARTDDVGFYSHGSSRESLSRAAISGDSLGTVVTDGVSIPSFVSAEPESAAVPEPFRDESRIGTECAPVIFGRNR